MMRDDWIARFAAEVGAGAPSARETHDLLELAGIAAHASAADRCPAGLLDRRSYRHEHHRATCNRPRDRGASRPRCWMTPSLQPVPSFRSWSAGPRTEGFARGVSRLEILDAVDVEAQLAWAPKAHQILLGHHPRPEP